MNGSAEFPEGFLALVDDYCDDLIDEAGFRELELCLSTSELARRHFAEYYLLHTELQFSLRARRAAASALGRFAAVIPTARRLAWVRPGRWTPLAAGLLVAALGVGAGQWFRTTSPSPNVAWLVNAQDCVWEGGDVATPGRDMHAGKHLTLRSGLAEIEFERGARVILQGPSGLELITGNSARLKHGSLTAKVPESAHGFTIESPSGKVVDLGTEFGLAVDRRGLTDVRVFQGEVIASPLARGGQPAAETSLLRGQEATIGRNAVALRPAQTPVRPDRFVRRIQVPPVIVPRTLTLDFDKAVPGTLMDVDGLGTGFTTRLPGTGMALLAHDRNLRLDTAHGVLELTTTNSDLNTQVNVPDGEYPGFRLGDLGYTGTEDFAVSASIRNIPDLALVGQLGLFVGRASDVNTRGGLISNFEQPDPARFAYFLVNNHGGKDADLLYLGAIRIGDDLRLTLRRLSGVYSLLVENLTLGSSSTLSIAQPTYLDGPNDLSAGFFGANTQSQERRKLTIDSLSATVWTITPATGTEPPAAP